MTPRRAFIIDVDNTLLDTERIKETWKNHFKSGFIPAYKKSKHRNGYLDTKKLAKLLSVNPDYFYKTQFRKFLFKNALTDLKNIAKLGRVTIFSVGETTFQPLKIINSGIEKTVGSKNVHIVQNKRTGIKELIANLRKERFDTIFMVDDISNNLTDAYRVLPKVINVWVRYGKYKNKYPLIRNSVTYEAANFTQSADYLSRFVGIVQPLKSSLKLSVLKNIDESQTRDLIKITKIDRKISNFTHDLERFKNTKTFSVWKRRGKTIYTLIDRTGKLRGIIWFSKKLYKKAKYTFAIRIYKPMRGKKLAKKFMAMAINDFSAAKRRSLWLETTSDNTTAHNLYKSFGFKVTSESGKTIKMCLTN